MLKSEYVLCETGYSCQQELISYVMDMSVW